MDLRDRNLTEKDISRIHDFILLRKLCYQPFIFRDDLEVGEGMEFHDGEFSGGEVYWKGADPRAASLVKDEALAHFRECNAALRKIYEHFLDSLTSQLGDISRMSFAEVGCNSGYFLYGLGLRGAARTIGFDFTLYEEVFGWFNRVLGTGAEFRWAEWDSLHHELRYAEMPEVDVALSVAVTCHLPDALYHLAYLCDRSRKAVFFWSPVNERADLSLSFGEPAKYQNSLNFPICFDNDVRPSVPLLRLALEQSGFADIREVEPPPGLSPQWLEWYRNQKGYIAFRTDDRKTALSGVKARRDLPEDHPEVVGRRDRKALVSGVRGRLGRARRRLLGF